MILLDDLSALGQGVKYSGINHFVYFKFGLRSICPRFSLVSTWLFKLYFRLSR